MSHPYSARPVAATHNWLTPRFILDALGRFDLDPCAAPGWTTADRMICLPDDGLTAEWQGRVWCNPPFGDQTAPWLTRMAEHGNGIALTFARTDTQWFADLVFAHASGVLFLTGRPHFHHPDGSRAKGNSGGPICLIAYGNRNAGALAASELPGAFFGRALFQPRAAA